MSFQVSPTLRAWLREQSNAELEALKDTPRFTSEHNRQLLLAIIRERREGPPPESAEDDEQSR